MALTALTYGGLKSAIADWLRRSDLTDAQLADCVLMFENHANRVLRVRQMEATDTLNTTSGVDTLPSDFLTWRSLTWGGTNSNKELEYVHPTYLRATYPTAESGTPNWFTIEGENITIRPYDDTNSFTLRYWQKIPDLESAGDGNGNWLLSAHPDLYLAGSLYCTYKFIRDAEGAMYYKQVMDEAIAEVQMLSEKSKVPTIARPTGTIP